MSKREIIALHPAHASIRGKRRAPPAKDRIKMPSHEHLECLERIVLSIFADMTNVGWPLTDILVAVYLTGANHALEATKP